MNIDQLFKTEKEKAQAEEKLKTLKKSEGWRFIKSILEKEIENLNNLILEGHIESIEKINELKQQRWNLVHLKNLPDELLEGLSEAEEKPINNDPYATIEEVAKGEDLKVV